MDRRRAAVRAALPLTTPDHGSDTRPGFRLAGIGPSALWNVKFLRAAAQIVFLVAVVALVAYLFGNLTSNLRRIGIGTSFDFLDRPARFQVSGRPFVASDSVRTAIVAGARNTLAVAIPGVILTTVLGVLVGTARLSTNWLVRKSAAVYVEVLRNVPPLLVITFLLLAVAFTLPGLEDAPAPLGLAVISVKGVVVASPMAGERFGVYSALLAAALVVAVALGVWRTRVSDRTGVDHHRILVGGAIMIGTALAAYVALGTPIRLSRPEIAGRIVEGGEVMRPEYATVMFGLVLYTASHVAEIVRGSILAVPRGQNEAASALALTSFQRLRFVVLPQAFRIAIPPTINQYLNYTKNTSLGIAVAYAEITTITFILIGNANPAPQLISILMLVYLTFSLVISALVNLLNRRLRLVEQ